MPKELPGFYYDEAKNRYFPIKGRIPGSSPCTSSSISAKKSVSKPNQGLASVAFRRRGIKAAKLLQGRELCGNLIPSSKGKLNFEEEYLRLQATQPSVFKYHDTSCTGDGAIEQIHVDVDMPDGSTGTDILLTGGVNGSLCLYEVGKVGQDFYRGVNCMGDQAWPLKNENGAACKRSPAHLWKPAGASIYMPSNISCIKMSGMLDATSSRRVLITTLGSETSGGSVYILNLREPLDYNQNVPIIRRRIHEITSLNCTVWTADCNSDGSRASVGTNLGAALVNVETGITSWLCRCKSDVLSLQIDNSGNLILCGLRNGAILTVDARQKPQGNSNRLIRHRIPHPYLGSSEPSSRIERNLTKQRFELKGNVFHSRTAAMPSSISCLASLKLYDEYFLASSMDGSIKLYDHRLIQRGAVQSYEGNVNSHTRIQLGVDPSEKIVMSGGEDCYMRLWSIKSGELLFQDKFTNSVPSVMCWPRTKRGGYVEMQDRGEYHRDDGHNPRSGAWVGTHDGLFHMHFSIP